MRFNLILGGQGDRTQGIPVHSPECLQHLIVEFFD